MAEPSQRSKLSGAHLLSCFQSPPAAYRGKPLWSWNGHLETTELRRQVGVLAEMGLGGFFMHGRTGLATKYMGREWLSAVKTCAIEARKLGLESWLYDEDRWPSGAAGGLATKDSRFRMRYLRCEILSQKQMAATVKNPVIALFAGKIKDLNLHSYRRVEKPTATLLAEESFLRFTLEIVQPHSFFNGGTYLNTLDSKAVQEFLRLTHEEYYKACGKMFGNTIPGIFTDEPHHGFVMCETPEGWLYPPDSGWVTPWADDFPGHFKKEFAYDLRDRLPELFFRLRGEKLSCVKWQYMEMLHRQFLDSWARPIFEWCNRHKLRLTGHLLAEDLPGDQSITCGSVLRYYEFMETPGMDQLLLNNHSFWMAKQVASAARQTGRKWMLSELYGVTGWQLDFDGHKEIGDWQAFLGINLRCHHLAWYGMAGEAKRDFPASIFFQSAWYREYRAVEDYYARIHLLLQQGQAVCDILVLHPVESVWAQIHAGWATFIKNQSPDIAPVDRTFVSIFRWITDAQLDFDYGDEEQLGRLGRVESQPQTTLRVGKARYRTVVVAGMATIRSSTLKILKKFRDAGGSVIFAGTPPSHLDALPSVAPADFGETATSVPLTRAALITALCQAAPPLVRIENAGPRRNTLPLILQIRREGETWTVAICNTDASRQFPSLTVVFEGRCGQVQEWDCRTGQRYAVASRQTRKTTRWQTSLTFSGERIFRIVPEIDPLVFLQPSHRKTVTHKIRGPFAYHLDEPNALVLDNFQWRIGQNNWQPAEDILSIDRKVREHFDLPARGHGMMQPWARPSRKVNLTNLDLRTDFNVRSLPEGSIYLLMEQPALWKVKLNGVSLDTGKDEGWFIDPCFRKIPIPSATLSTGINKLELCTGFAEGVDLEAVYLLGAFGVYGIHSSTPYIDHLPATLKIGDACKQGLPHYTGRIQYELKIPATTKKHRKFRIPLFGGAVTCLALPGGEPPVVLPFKPHETILSGAINSLICEVVLTRRNIFGPLHLRPKKQNAITPASFRSTSSAYSLIPQLYPSGLLLAPETE